MIWKYSGPHVLIFLLTFQITNPWLILVNSKPVRHKDVLYESEWQTLYQGLIRFFSLYYQWFHIPFIKNAKMIRPYKSRGKGLGYLSHPLTWNQRKMIGLSWLYMEETVFHLQHSIWYVDSWHCVFILQDRHSAGGSTPIPRKHLLRILGFACCPHKDR